MHRFHRRSANAPATLHPQPTRHRLARWLVFLCALPAAALSALPAGPDPLPDTGTPARSEALFVHRTDLANALAELRASDKVALAVLFDMEGCGECARLKATVFQTPEVVARYRQDFVALSVRADEPGPLVSPDGALTTQSDFARHERIQALPTVVFYDRDGLPVARQIGSRLPPAEWLRLAEHVRTRGYEEAPFVARALP